MNENLYNMIVECCRRSRSGHTPEYVAEALQTCPSLITKEGFYIYQIFRDEMQILFGYVKPGVDGRKYLDILEDIGRINHCRKVSFATHREAGFARLYPDYRPAARIFEKELN